MSARASEDDLWRSCCEVADKHALQERLLGALAEMTDWLRHYWEIVSTSLWFVPFLMGVSAMGLAMALLTWGTGIPDDTSSYWLLYTGDIDNARELLSTLMAGMITMTSLVVSITMVVLTLAAAQIGPRLIRTFIQDRTTQVVLGLFLADILYLLIVFRTIDGERLEEVPHLAVSTGTGLTGLCLFVLLFYVHRLARSIIFDNVIQNVAVELRHSVDHLLPKDAENHCCPGEPGNDFRWVTVGKDGYIQTIDLDALVATARHANAVIRLEVGPGDYVIGEGEHVAVHPASASTEKVRKRIRGAFIVGSERSASQDIEFGLRQLVEIATRALSPGLNDVFTALAVIDNLSSSLVYIFNRGSAPPCRRDADGTIRIIRVVPDYEGLVGTAFDQIRQAGSGHPAILIRLTEAIARLAPCVRSQALRQPLLEQLDTILATGEQTITISRDLNILRARWRRARDRLEG